MTPTSIGLLELVGLAYILVCSGIPPKLTSQASKLHLASSTLVSLSQIVDLRKNILPLLLFSIQRYEKIESKYGAKCENLLSVFTIASNPGHLAPFSQKKGRRVHNPCDWYISNKNWFCVKISFRNCQRYNGPSINIITKINIKLNLNINIKSNSINTKTRTVITAASTTTPAWT